jgi:hypothetical protein
MMLFAFSIKASPLEPWSIHMQTGHGWLFFHQEHDSRMFYPYLHTPQLHAEILQYWSLGVGMRSSSMISFRSRVVSIGANSFARAGLQGWQMFLLAVDMPLQFQINTQWRMEATVSGIIGTYQSRVKYRPAYGVELAWGFHYWPLWQKTWAFGLDLSALAMWRPQQWIAMIKPNIICRF